MKRLCDVFDNEINRIAQEIGSRAKAFKLAARDTKLVRFYLPLQPPGVIIVLKKAKPKQRKDKLFLVNAA